MHKCPPHSCPTRPDSATCEQHCCLRVGVASSFFFFVSRLAPIGLKLEPIRAKSGQFTPTWAVSGETAETHWYQRRTGQFRPKFQKKKKGRFEDVGDVRECLCVRQRENERENKLNKYLSAFGIQNEGLICGLFCCWFFPVYHVSIWCFGWLYCFLSFRLMKFQSPFKKRKQKCVEWVVGVGRVINRGDI